jgi:phosphoribosyl 1,2-cyclic phosphate phosphodiesterase
MSVRITFLGTGTSQGVPLIACPCPVCQSSDPRDKRLRSSILIQSDTTTVVIDAGPDFRQQLIRANVKRLDAVVFTHSHKDHLAGLDDIRAFNYLQGKAMDLYATQATQQQIRTEFAYIFAEHKYPGIPEVNMIEIDKDAVFTVGDIQLKAIEVMHYKMQVLGFRVHDFTYITDANFIAPAEIEKIEGSKYLVLNALRREPHISHFTLEQAVDMAHRIHAKHTYFTHISHQLGFHEDVNQELGDNISLAYDMLSFEI